MSTQIAGLPGAPGIAVGPAWRYRHGAEVPDAVALAGHDVASPGMSPEAGSSSTTSRTEKAIRDAAMAAWSQLTALAARLVEMNRSGEAEILEAQALMAVDPVLVEQAVSFARRGMDPAPALLAAAEMSARTLAALDDPVLAARASDVRDVAARVARTLAGTRIELPAAPSIVVGEDFPPSFLAEAPPGLLLGVVLSGGAPTAHVAILARSLGIPVVVCAAGLLEAVRGKVSVAIDGESGEVVIDPSTQELRELADIQASRQARGLAAAASRDRPASTGDGHRVRLLANIRSPEDAPRAIEAAAEGVGLFRTEYLFMRRDAPPSEDEQTGAYARVMREFGSDRPVVIRLADIGGDKAIPYLGLGDQPNPFLGVRAIRLAQGSRDLLLTQLRAIWRAGGEAGVTPIVMAPMVATLEDARLLLELRDEARAGVVRAAATWATTIRGVSRPLPERMVTGAMIEVPSAAILAPELARLVDFFSIGTNDLTQYVLAADRGNPSLARLQDALHPAVLRTIASVVAGAGKAGIPVAVCGELAGDPLGALVLVGLGIDELSMEIDSLDLVRAAVARVSLDQLHELAALALAATEAGKVRAAARALLAD